MAVASKLLIYTWTGNKNALRAPWVQTDLCYSHSQSSGVKSHVLCAALKHRLAACFPQFPSVAHSKSALWKQSPSSPCSSVWWHPSVAQNRNVSSQQNTAAGDISANSEITTNFSRRKSLFPLPLVLFTFFSLYFKCSTVQKCQAVKKNDV